MPKMVKIAPAKGFNPADAAQKTAYAEAKKRGAIEVPYATAIENVKLSGGMYQIVTGAPEPEPEPELEPEPVKKPINKKE
jgi:hypothetical protein